VSQRTSRILVVDDEETVRDALTLTLESWGYTAQAVETGSAALRVIERGATDLILTDLVMPEVDGLAILRKAKAEAPDVPVLILSGQGSINEAVEAIRQGAYDFIVKPCEPPRLRVTLERALEQAQTRREVTALRRRVRDATPGGGDFIGQSRVMREVFTLIEKVARAIHNLSPRKDKPFIAINCSAIPATLMESEIFGYERGAFTGADQRRLGCFELADGGTLFLDEVGEIPPELQAKFLRVLEEEKLRRLGGKAELSVDVRVLAATNRELKEQISSGQFREDFYFRLNVFNIPLPPLRDRPEDIPALVDHFVRRFARDGGKKVPVVSPAAQRRLADYRWPGNIRELRNCVERAVLLCDGDAITEAHLPNDVLERDGEAAIRLSLGQKLREVTRAYIEATLARSGGNKARSAQTLGISEKTLYNKLHRYAEDDERSGVGGFDADEDEDEEAQAVAC
jgi:DNA-binding NtrC family response regulator